MAEHVRIEDLGSHTGQEVLLRGWLYNKRGSKKIQFLEVRDGSGIVQAIVGLRDVDEETFEAAKHLAQESSIEIQGVVNEHPKRPGEYELHTKALRLIAEPTEEYPITPKEHGVDFLMDHRHLWLRSRRQHAILRVRAEVIAAVRAYFDDNGFTLVDAPIFTPNACEGTSTLFETDYHGDTAYLSQSGQLYMEAAAAALGKVYCLGPTFRAEKSKTRRHLAEFWMVEPEVAFMDLEGDMALAEDFLVHIVARVLDRRAKELEILERDTSKLEMVKGPFPRLRYEDAITLLQSKGVDTKIGDDFGGDDETIIAESFDRPVIVTHYPAAIKAFYMKRDPEDERWALGMDVLAPEGYGEIIGGGVREESLDVLDARIRAHDLPIEAFDWYRDLRKYGSFPHAGFGLGIERTVAWICGLKHVRETIPFPRMLNRLHP
ncbi:MAG: asparagine--tRNA ligase [Sandaracinus sp.]|nr:asparagine--tRNA ligase [Sandaracinus sp.]MAR57369.1 asparagine--tRNA ligase [Rickettsiales bacterium]